MTALKGRAGSALAAALLCAAAPAARAAPSGSPLDAVRERVRHAGTCYWFGMAEKGNMDAFRRGLRLLEEAEEGLASLPKEAADSPTRRLLGREIGALRSDLDEQAEMAHDTLYGVFPLVRLLAPTLFADASANGTFELVDEPEVIAVCAASEDLRDGSLKEWKIQAQLDVVFRSLPPRPALENEALYVFNASPRFFVRNRRQVASALSPAELKAFRAGDVSVAPYPHDVRERGTELPVGVAERLCRAFGVPRLLVVTIRELDVVDGDHFYRLEGRVLAAAGGEPSHSISRLGFCRDRRGQFPAVLLGNAALLLLACLVYVALARREKGERRLRAGLLAVPALAFVLGRTIPWVLVPVVAAVAPEAETLAKLSFWWPCAIGAALFLGPAAVCWFASARAPAVVRGLDVHGSCGVVLAAVAMGVCAYLAGPLLLYLGAPAIASLLPLVTAAGLIAYILGRALDRSHPLPAWACVFPAVAALGLGLAVCHAAPGYLWLGAGVVACSGAAAAAGARLSRLRGDEAATAPRARRRADEASPADGGDGETVARALPADALALAQLAADPPYRRFGTFERASALVSPALDGRNAWLALWGARGVGKTATAREVIAELGKGLRRRRAELALLRGGCPEAEEEREPYAPFREALARHFKVNLLAASEGQIAHVWSALGGMVESMLPLPGILFPPADEAASAAVNREAIFRSISRTVGRLADRRTVALFIDDAQWIDDASRDLLRFLLRSFPAGEPGRVAVIVTSTGRKDVLDLGMQERHLREVEQLDTGQITEVLNSSLGLAPGAAEAIVGKLGVPGPKQGGLFWLFRVVAHLARRGVFRREDDGFALKPEYSRRESLPLPAEFRETIEQQLKEFPEHRPVLQCAACLGRNFSAGVLADSLGMSRMKALQVLERIEEETGILYDVTESDDVFDFRSPFMLEAVRESLGISGSGPKAADVPQVVREYHARVAAALERTLEHSSGALFDVASHYYAAGLSKAEDGLRFCRTAARSASAVFDHSNARMFLARARECAEALGRGSEVEEELLLLEWREAHVEAEREALRKAAEESLAYLETHENAPAKMYVAAARACFDARRFDKAAEMGREVVRRAGSPAERAEGHQFVGISLPFREAEERRRHLEAALEESKAAPDDDPEALALRARIMNSLANQLCNDPTRDEERARCLLACCMEARTHPEVMDWPGLARDHGALGGLALEAGDIEEARAHFEEDLRISLEKTGDLQGQSVMNSRLGECDLREGKHEDGIGHYRAAFRLAQDAQNKIFAGAGLLECLCAAGLRRAGAASAAQAGRREEIDRFGPVLLTIARGKGVPDRCARNVRSAIEKCAGLTDAAWLEELGSLV